MGIMSVYLCVQSAQAVLIALFTLNTPLFSVMLRTIPKTFQVILFLYCLRAGI